MTGEVINSKFRLMYNIHASDDFENNILDVVFDRAVVGAEKAASLVYDDMRATLSRPSTDTRPWQPAFHPSRRTGEMLGGLYEKHMTSTAGNRNLPHVEVGNTNPKGLWQETGAWAVGLFGEDPYPYPWAAPAVSKNRTEATEIIKKDIKGKKI